MNNLNKLISKTPSNWRNKAEKRISEKDWKKNSRAVAITVLSQLREKNLTQTDLANLIGVSRQQISKIVKGQENLTFETVGKLEKALDITIMKIANKSTNENVTKISLPTIKVEPRIFLSVNKTEFLQQRTHTKTLLEFSDTVDYMAYDA